MGRATTAARMTALVAQWQGSGEPQARFARRHGVRPWTLWYWSQKVGRSRRPAPPRPARRAFVPVTVVAESASAGATVVEVVLPTGERLGIPAGTSREHVGAILAALRAPC